MPFRAFAVQMVPFERQLGQMEHVERAESGRSLRDVLRFAMRDKVATH